MARYGTPRILNPVPGRTRQPSTRVRARARITWSSGRGTKTSYPSPRVCPCPLNDGPPPRSSRSPPTPRSVKAARGLAGAGSGRRPGSSTTSSGAVCRQLSGLRRPGRAGLQCSCPSRKFPCKHALGLLMRWADSGVPDGARAALRRRVAGRARGRRGRAAGHRDARPGRRGPARRAARRAGRRRHGRAATLARRPGAAGAGRGPARPASSRSTRWPPGWSTPRRRRPRAPCGGWARSPASGRTGPTGCSASWPCCGCWSPVTTGSPSCRPSWPPPSAPGSASRSPPRRCWPAPGSPTAGRCSARSTPTTAR